MLRKGDVEALVVAKLDRLTRSVRDLGQLLDDHFGAKGKSALLSVSEQIDGRAAGGRMVLNLLTAVAQWERETIGERVKTAMQHMRSQGRRVGQIGYGWRLAAGSTTVLEPEPSEQAVIAQARELRASGLTLRTICGELTTRGHLSRAGKPFGSAQVLRMVA